MFPTNSLVRALKDKPDALVCILLVLVGVAGARVATGDLDRILVSGIVICGFAFYHTRRSAAERHERVMAERKVDEAVLMVDRIKARYQISTDLEQPELPLIVPRTRRRRVDRRK